ncbi:p53-like transcription factor DNA-binding, partial [Penicillium robsamsonii]|uniref:p53-like transcription factor DNA-binding n=1 Tax=Penicillium robsamsonii TaxID=1792511 RepID=UPI0025467DB1
HFSLEVFSLNDPVTSEGDYINSHVTGFGTDEDDNSQRVGGLVSMPDTNGVRYHAQQPVMQDLQYSGSSALAMTPPDSCPDSFSPTSGPLYPHISRLQHPFDRMADYQRVPALQPPTGMPASMQSSGHSLNLNSIPALMGRNNSYGSYALQRGIGNISMPLGGMNDLSRSHGYPGTPRALDSGMDRSQNNVYQQPIVESSQHSQPQVEAPPFDDTTILHTVVAEFGGQYQTVKPDVQAKMGRGPFPAEGKWTCYRRNYFAVTCGFGLHPGHPLLLYTSAIPTRPLNQSVDFRWPFLLSSTVNTEKLENLFNTPRSETNNPNANQVVSFFSLHPHLHLQQPRQSMEICRVSRLARTPQPCQPPTSHVFERIQFQKATANNGKRRAQQQYYNLVVELYAEVASSVLGETEWVQIARRHSHPLVVRGRSPGHYKDGRRGSTGSMGPDGAGGDNTCGVLPHGLGQTGRSHMPMYDTSHRAGLSYGRSDHRKMNVTDNSPLSDSPLISSSSSSGFEYSMIDTMDPMDTIKSDLYLKSDPYQDNTYAGVPSHQQRQSNAGGYDPVYSTTYGRYDPIQNSHSLCT